MSSHFDIFSKEEIKLNSYKALILGCIPTEAHIKTDSIDVTIAQNTNEPLMIIKRLIELNYPNIIKNNLNIKDLKYPILNIKSPFFRWLLVEIYGIQKGNATKNREVPKQVLDNEELILGFLGGVFSLEGGFSVLYSKIHNQYDIVVSLEMLSKKFVSTIRDILVYRGYTPENLQYDRGCWYFRLQKNREKLKFIYEIIPWFIHRPKLIKPRKAKISFVESMKFLVDKIHYSNPEIKDIIKRSRKKAGNSTELSHVINKELGLNYSKRIVNRWLYENRRPSIRIIYFLTKYIKMKPAQIFENNVLPEEFSLLFYMHKYITKKEFENIRKRKLLIDLN